MNQAQSIYAFKPAFQSLLRPVMNGLSNIGITPNQITLAAVALSLAAGSLIAWARGGRMLLVLPAVLLVRMAMNALDGMLARERNRKSPLGAILNELGDVVSDAALYLPLAAVAGFTPWLVVAIVLLAALTEMTGVTAVMIGSTRRYDGPFGKSDRALFFGLLGLLVGSGVRIEPAIPFVLCAVILLLMGTIFNRARGALRESTLIGGVL